MVSKSPDIANIPIFDYALVSKSPDIANIPIFD